MNLSTSDIRASSSTLATLLSSSYVLASKLQNFHWNVEDARFDMLHKFFGDQYTPLILAIDEIAERIRMLGEYAPASLSTYLKLSIVKESSLINQGQAMLEEISSDHKMIIELIRKSIEQMNTTNDQGTLDFLIGRLREHEKLAWLTSSHKP